MELLEQPWVRELFLGFMAWDGWPKVAGNLTARIDCYATFFSKIDQQISSPTDLSQQRLFEVFGADGLRKAFLTVEYLVHRLCLPWSEEILEDMAERRRIETMRFSWQKQPCASILDAYMTVLLSDADLRARTVRVYLNAALRFLNHADLPDVATLENAHLERFLKKSPGQRASLARFLGYLREQNGILLEAVPIRQTNPGPSDRRLIRDVKVLLRTLNITKDGREGRALLAAAISKAYQVPIKRILTLRLAQVKRTETTVTLWPADLAISLDEPLRKAFRRWVPNANAELIFPGRNGAHALSYDAVRYHVGRALGSV